MKQILLLFVLVSCALAASAFAEKPKDYQTATVVSVESHDESPSNYAGSNPSDAPLQAEVYSYDIGIRIGCIIYRTRYDSAIDYLPAVFSPNHPVQVNVSRHVLNVSLPGYREVRMPIDGHSSVRDQACMARN